MDLLTRLQEGKDDSGQLLGKEELTVEALTQLIAGSDTTSKCASQLYTKYPANPLPF
jgi:benzoate 4-monooxygenase